MKRITKRILALVLSVLLIVAVFAGCSSNGDSTKSDKNEKFAVVVQSGANGAFVDMKDGIVSKLVANGYNKDNIVYKDAQGDPAALTSIISGLDDGSYEAVFTIGTACTQAMVNLNSDTPCFFCAVSAPVEAKVITDMNTPDKNATGTSNAIPVGDIIEMGQKITPNVKKWGFVYSTSQVNAVDTVKSAQKYLDSKKIKYDSATVETSADVKSAAETLISNGCDVIFVPNDAVIQDGVTALAEVCGEAGIPTYCSSATTVKSGCLATLAIDDKGIGEKTAQKYLDYVAAGKDITKVKSEVVGIDDCTFNKTVAEKIKVSQPDENTIGYPINAVETATK